MEKNVVPLLISRLEIELEKQDRGGVYGYTQRNLVNKIEGSKLTPEQISSLFETRTIKSDSYLYSKDIEEATGHFTMFNDMIKSYQELLSENLIKEYHSHLKSGVFEDRANMVSNIKTTPPIEVEERIIIRV